MTATVCFSGTLPAIILFAFNVFDKPVFLLACHIVEDGQCEDFVDRPLVVVCLNILKCY